MASAYVNKVTGITGYTEDGSKILTEYDSETGVVTFESAPAVIKYFYDTGFDNSSMDVTIHSSGYQEEQEEVIEPDILGNSGGCNFGLSLSSLILASFVFVKRR